MHTHKREVKDLKSTFLEITQRNSNTQVLAGKAARPRRRGELSGDVDLDGGIMKSVFDGGVDGSVGEGFRLLQWKQNDQKKKLKNKRRQRWEDKEETKEKIGNENKRSIESKNAP